MERVENSIIDEGMLGIKKEEMELADLDNCEVVRRQYLAHTRDNLLTIKPDGIQFNNICIARMVGVEYIYILIDRENRRLMITPCSPDDKDGQRWCLVKNGVRKSRKLRGKPFSDLLYRLLGWCKGYYYRICGVPALAKGDEDRLVMVFNFDEAEKIPMTRQQRLCAGVEPEELTDQEKAELAILEDQMMTAKENGRRSTYQRLGVSYPDNWEKDSFGEKAVDHENRPSVPTWDELKPENVEKKPASSTTTEEKPVETAASEIFPTQTSVFKQAYDYNGSGYGQSRSAVSL
jgi:hypothetical protein